ncbi:MAG: M48 family metalloprotease [Chloroflexi bacterium]|nr:M48 family metalloprotease [Chloroflexota bacterium]
MKCSRITRLIFSGLIFLSVFLFSSPAYALITGFINRDTEIKIGEEISKQVEQENGGAYSDPRVTRIGKSVAARSGRQDLPYSFKVLKTDKVNAVSLPGGFVYIYKGLLDVIGKDDDMLAYVLAHEAEHAAQKHVIKSIENEMSTELILSLALGKSSQTIQQMAGIGWNIIQLGYSRENEYDADHWGVSDMILAGYNPWGAIQMLEKFKEMSSGKSIEWLGTHPNPEDRIKKLETDYAQQLAKAKNKYGDK